MRRLFIMRKDLNMSPGKLAAQVGHCAEAYWTNLMKHCEQEIEQHFASKHQDENNEKPNEFYYLKLDIPKEIYEDYICGAFTKTICQARNKNHLLKAKTIADELCLQEGSDYGMIYDKCLTELEPEEDNGTTLTGIWFKPLPDEVAHEISKKYHLYI